MCVSKWRSPYRKREAESTLVKNWSALTHECVDSITVTYSIQMVVVTAAAAAVAVLLLQTKEPIDCNSLNNIVLSESENDSREQVRNL